MATFLAHITVKPGRETDFEGIVTALYRATHDREPGVRRYEYWRGSGDRTYYTHASFEDWRAFLDHQTSDHHEAAGPELKEVIESIRLEWVDPLSTSSPLGATDMQPLPDGASQLAAKYQERFAVDGQWWLTLRRAPDAMSRPAGTG
jgi:quinol monooxygenase YgiN